MALACGIDFGTSNSTLTLVGQGTLHPVVVDPTNPIPEAIPTVLYFDEHGVSSYGSEAVQAYVDSDMSGRFLQSIKRHLPSPDFTGTTINGRLVSVEELVAGFLEHMKFLADREAGEPVTQVVLGRPAVYHTDPRRDQLAQDRMEVAAAMAGFTDIRFQREPMAAARAFEQELDRDLLCLVGDLGGGTSDFTLVRLGPGRLGGNRAADVVATNGVSVAGNDFDARLVWAAVVPHLGVEARYRPATRWVQVPTVMHHAVCRWHQLCLAATPENLRFLDRIARTADDAPGIQRLRALIADNHAWPFFRAIEDTKVGLSNSETAELVYDEGIVSLAEEVERGRFEQAISREAAKLERTVDELLQSVSMSWEDVGVVFLTGGSSRVPRVRRLFEERFGDRIVDRGTFTSVGVGLAVDAAERFGVA